MMVGGGLFIQNFLSWLNLTDVNYWEFSFRFDIKRSYKSGATGNLGDSRVTLF